MVSPRLLVIDGRDYLLLVEIILSVFIAIALGEKTRHKSFSRMKQRRTTMRHHPRG
jgi:hypothetical protein